MAGNILNPEEHLLLTTIPAEINKADLVKHFTLSSEDRAVLDPRQDSVHRLSQAAHICLLRWLGWSPVTINRLPECALSALCQQLGINIQRENWQAPAARTSRIHAERARTVLGWKKYNAHVEHSLTEWLTELAEEQDQASILFDALCRHLYEQQIVRPGPDRLERLVESVRNTVREQITQRINAHLTSAQKEKLDELLVVQPGEILSPLQLFKETPKHASGNELVDVLDKIEAIRRLGLTDLKLSQMDIHPNRIKIMARRARQRTNWFTAQLRPPYHIYSCSASSTRPCMNTWTWPCRSISRRSTPSFSAPPASGTRRFLNRAKG